MANVSVARRIASTYCFCPRVFGEMPRPRPVRSTSPGTKIFTWVVALAKVRSSEGGPPFLPVGGLLVDRCKRGRHLTTPAEPRLYRGAGGAATTREATPSASLPAGGNGGGAPTGRRRRPCWPRDATRYGPRPRPGQAAPPIGSSPRARLRGPR